MNAFVVVVMLALTLTIYPARAQRFGLPPAEPAPVITPRSTSPNALAPGIPGLVPPDAQSASSAVSGKCPTCGLFGAGGDAQFKEIMEILKQHPGMNSDEIITEIRSRHQLWHDAGHPTLASTVNKQSGQPPSPPFAPYTSESDPFVVRIEIDSNDGSKMTNEAALTNWALDSHTATAFYDKEGGTLLSVLRRNLRTDDKRVWVEAVQLNRSGVKQNPVDSYYYKVRPGQLLLAPFGSLKHSGANPSNLVPVVVYRNVPKTDISEYIWYMPDAAQTHASRVFLLEEKQEGTTDSPAHQIIQLSITRSEVESLKKNGVKYEILTGKLIVHEAASHARGPIPLPPSTASALKTLFMDKPSRGKPLLIIIDDSWPSEAEYNVAHQFISSVYPQLWKMTSDVAKRPPPPSFEPHVLKAGAPKGSGCASLDSCNTHSQGIAYALKPFRELSQTSLGQEPVDIIYLPFTKAQEGAEDILVRLWDLQYLRQYKEIKVAEDPQNGFRNGLLSTYTEKEVPTNYGILYSVIGFAKLYSQYRQVPVLISLSWTSEDKTFENPGLNSNNILLIAAAGNDCKGNRCNSFIDDQQVPVEFIDTAKRYRNDVVVVMNVDSKGRPICDSNRVHTTAFSVVAFDGSIRGDCGTSYSTPRTAWLFGLSEAYYQSSPNFRNELFDTLTWIFSSGNAKRLCKNDLDFRCTALDVAGLLGTRDKQNHRGDKFARDVP